MEFEKIEFYNTPTGAIMYQVDGAGIREYTVGDHEITDFMLELIRSIYQQAFMRLSELYSASIRNREYFEYRMVNRFIRCNLGEYDYLHPDIDNGVLQLEEVKCPLRGMCHDEGLICKPKKFTQLSERELQIANMLAQGLTYEEMSQKLEISLSTIKNTIQHVKNKLNLKSSKEITRHLKQ
jgi:DNA-binding NarL/FixJ family response regulator